MLGWKPFSVVILLLSLSGCGAKFVYNNLDWLVLEYVDDYVTLTNDQESILEYRLQALAKWHRQTELPSYVEQIETLRNMPKSDLTADFILAQRKSIKQQIKAIIAQAAPDVYSLAIQATPEQEQEFLENFNEEQSKYLDKYLGLNDQETRELYAEKIGAGLDKWFGSITPKQQKIVNSWANEMEITTPEWRSYQTRILQTLERLFEKKSDTGYFQKTLMALLLEPESFYSEKLSQQIEKNMLISSEKIVLLLDVATDKQWAHYQGELKDLETLARDLM